MQLVNTWYDTALISSEGWYKAYTEGALNFQCIHQEMQALREVRCDECSSTFRREADKAKHKCLIEQQKPIHEQHGSTHCRYFKGGFGTKVA